MASQWHSLVSQKLFLARTLLDDSGTPADAPHSALRQEAALQGATELLLRARRLLLVMVARLYQQRSGEPDNLEALADLVGTETSELGQLQELARQGSSWWNHLEQLEAVQSRPPATKKTVSADNIIAVSAAAGPDRSSAGLRATLDAMKKFADDLEERHSEW